MNAGHIALAAGEFSSIDTSIFPKSSVEKGIRLRRSLQTNSSSQASLEMDYVRTGVAAVEYPQRFKKVTIADDGRIVEDDEGIDRAIDSATFMCAPGKFAVAQNTNSEFVFDLLEEATGVRFHPVEINTDSLRAEYPGAPVAGGDFRNEDGQYTGSAHTKKGSIEDTEELGGVFQESPKTTLRFTIPHKGHSVTLFVTESGYVQLDQPSSFTTQQFKEVVEDVVIPHTEVQN